MAINNNDKNMLHLKQRHHHQSNKRLNANDLEKTLVSGDQQPDDSLLMTIASHLATQFKNDFQV